MSRMAMFRPSVGRLNDISPGKFPIPQNPITRGVGVGRLSDITPAGFPVPQNPIRAVMTGGMGRLADITPALFPLPQNPICAGRGMSGLGCGCGCNGGANASGLQGLGDFISDPAITWLSSPSPIAAISNLTFWGGAIVALGAYLEFGRHHRR